MNNITEIIKKQISENSNLNLFFKNLKDNIEIDQSFLKTMLNLKKEKIADISGLTKKAVGAALEQFYDVNQFLQFEEGDKQELENIYIETFKNINEENCMLVMKQHFKMLSVWLSKHYSSYFIDRVSTNSKIGKVINSEYSPDFQMSLFDIDLDSLAEPVIDIGCGKNGNFINYLISKNKEAVGIDRSIVQPSGCLFEISWFDFKFEKNAWGTIFANMSFTNHFIHTVKFQQEKIPEYLKLYIKIINSLKSGGSFYYAPSLDFIEEKLDKNKFIFIRKFKNNIPFTELKKG